MHLYQEKLTRIDGVASLLHKFSQQTLKQFSQQILKRDSAQVWTLLLAFQRPVMVRISDDDLA